MAEQKISEFSMRSVVYSGEKTREMIPSLFKELGSSRVLLLSDRGLEKAGLVDKAAEIFNQIPKGEGPELAGIFLDIAQDAESSSVNEAVRYAKEIGADGLFALGGGSVLDTVKGVKFALCNGFDDIKDAIPQGIRIEQYPSAKPLEIPHIALPTTAGTGSEVSPFAVIFNEVIQMKTTIINPYLSADIAILDPEMTAGLPPAITAFTGFDALTHAIEALASPNATALTDAQALHAIRLIEKNLQEVVENGQNLESRMEMLQASLMGITAFTCALAAVPVHNFAHAYGALFRIPHGLANAVFLPVVMESIPELYLPKAKQMAAALNIRMEENEDSASLLAKSIEKIREMQQKTGLPKDFEDKGISAEDFEKTIQAVAIDPAGATYPLAKELIESIGQKVVPLRVK